MRTIVCFLSILLICSGVSLASPRSVTIPMNAMNDSGEDGTATFTEDGDKTIVVVDLKSGTATRQPSHLHRGSCDDYTPRPAYALQDVVNGKARSVVNERFDRIVSGEFILNVHRSYDDIATQASCGTAKH